MAATDLGWIGVDEERARAYVLAHGGEREKARLAGILRGERPDREVVKALEALQNPDGGFPLLQRPGGRSSVDTTCYILQQLKDMPPLAGSPMAQRAVSFLRRSQRVDGSWAEPEAVQPQAPPWTGAESTWAAPCLTAVATYTILTLDPDHMDPVMRADRWLRERLGDEEQLAGAPAEALLLAWAIWYRLRGPGDPEAWRAFEVLAERDLAPAQRGWWLSCALEVGAGGRYLIPLLRQLALLAGAQQEDGSWPGEAGYELEATLTALRVFRGYGLAGTRA